MSTALCSRVDCSEVAAAVVGFDAAAALVWLDPFDGRARGAGLLCATHADSFTPLRGCTLQDRRARAPRLWADRPRIVETVRSLRPSRATRRNRRAAGADPLPFEDVAAHKQATDRGIDDLDEMLDARTPLLARAFRATGAG